MKKKKILALIPARLQSTRLPQKVLLPIGGLPMVIHVYRRALLSKIIDDVVICCDDKKIMKVADLHNAKCVFTSKKHVNGTDRISEALKKMKKKFDLIIDIQGDEPLINPKHIDKLIKFHLKNLDTDIVIPSLAIKNFKNKNLVKIVANTNNDILYLSRQEIPYGFKSKNHNLSKHLSIVSFKPKSLIRFSNLKRSKLEILENIELLRALDYNMKLKTFFLNGKSFSVDVRKDYIKANKFIQKDKIFKKYR